MGGIIDSIFGEKDNSAAEAARIQAETQERMRNAELAANKEAQMRAEKATAEAKEADRIEKELLSKQAEDKLAEDARQADMRGQTGAGVSFADTQSQKARGLAAAQQAIDSGTGLPNTGLPGFGQLTKGQNFGQSNTLSSLSGFNTTGRKYS